MSFLKLITSVNKATLHSYNICGTVSLDTMNSALTAMNDTLPNILTELWATEMTFISDLTTRKKQPSTDVSLSAQPPSPPPPCNAESKTASVRTEPANARGHYCKGKSSATVSHHWGMSLAPCTENEQVLYFSDPLRTNHDLPVQQGVNARSAFSCSRITSLGHSGKMRSSC